MAGTKVTLKLLVDQTRRKVLFAEAGKDFVDFLFSILTLPVGRVVELLGSKEMAGSLGDLYRSIETLSSTYMQPNQSTKSSVLKPQALISSSKTPLLLPSTTYSSPTTKNFYRCNHGCLSYISEDPNAVCPGCRQRMGSKVTYVESPQLGSSPSPTKAGDEGGYVKGVVTYMVMDDLEVKPMSTISSITLLNQFHVKDLSSLREKVVEMRLEEAIKLLKASLKSKRVLTDVFFKSVCSGGVANQRRPRKR